MASAAMEAFFSATRAKPQSEEELQSVLAELPRRELQALSKTHGVKATLKRESLVEMLVRALKEKLWPVVETAVANAEEPLDREGVKDVEKDSAWEDKDTVEEGTAKPKEEGTAKQEEVAKEETVSGEAGETRATIEEATLEEVDKDAKKPGVGAKKQSATANIVVGKKTAVQRKTSKLSESAKANKFKKTATVKVTAKAVSPSVVLEKLHAKEIAKQPTLQQHDHAKKQRAAVLLSSTTKFSAVKKTRSKTKALADAALTADKSITKTLSFGVPTPVKHKPPVSAPAALETQKDGKKGGAGYKPYVGKVPAYDGDSLFSPKKAKPRPAPMAVAVMKAARVTTPKKAAATPTNKAVSAPPKKAVPTPSKKPAVPTQNKKAAPGLAKKPASPTTAKKSTTAPTSSSSDKENSLPPESCGDSIKKPTNALVTKPGKPMGAAGGAAAIKATAMKARVSVKAASMNALSQEAKQRDRRAQFAQNAKTEATATRRQARCTPSVASSK